MGSLSVAADSNRYEGGARLIPGPTVVPALIAKTGTREHYKSPSPCLHEVQMKVSRLLIIALGAPISLAAQQPPAALPPNAITAAFKTRLAAQNRNILQAFDSIPESKFSYKPTPAQLSIGFIAAHLANDNYFSATTLCDERNPAAPDTTTADSVKALAKGAVDDEPQGVVRVLRSASNQLDDAKLAEPVTITFGGNSRTVARTGMVLGHALTWPITTASSRTTCVGTNPAADRTAATASAGAETHPLMANIEDHRETVTALWFAVMAAVVNHCPRSRATRHSAAPSPQSLDGRPSTIAIAAPGARSICWSAVRQPRARWFSFLASPIPPPIRGVRVLLHADGNNV